MTWIINAKDTPLNQQAQGTVPDVSGALQDWLQPLTFELLLKTVSGFQVVETPSVITLQGVIQPLGKRELLMKPEGERGWTWFEMTAQFQPKLEIDDVVTYLGKQTRVMTRANSTIYGFIDYTLVQDWTGSGP